MSNKDTKKLYLVTDYRIPFNELLEKTKEALIGGVYIVQYRAKNKKTKEMCKEAKELKKLCDDFGALFLVNDRIDVALAVKANGVHIGQDDMEVSIAREIMPKDAVIGVTVHNKEEALKAIADEAINRKTGARGLRAIVEETMMDIMFDIPSEENIVKATITEETIKDRKDPELEKLPEGEVRPTLKTEKKNKARKDIETA